MLSRRRRPQNAQRATLTGLIALLPLRVAYRLGQALGFLSYVVCWPYRRLAVGNLALAYGDTLSRAEVRRLARLHFTTLGANLLCSVKASNYDAAKLQRIAQVEGMETIRAAAPHQHARGRVDSLKFRADDLRLAVKEGHESNLILFCVDASGSMGSRTRMSAVKAAVLSLLLDAYQRRDKVGLVTFRGAGATLDLPPTSSVENPISPARIEWSFEHAKRMPADTRPAASASPSCASSIWSAPIAASGLMVPLPLWSGAVPPIGSNMLTPAGLTLPPAAMPIPPWIIAPRSVMMSPNMLSVTITSNRDG